MNKQNNHYVNRNIRFFINLYLYLYLFKVQFNNSVPIIGNILGAGYTYIFILGWNSMITYKQQFDWIIKMGCNLIGPKIDYLNTNAFKEYNIKKSCVRKKCKQQKEKCVPHEVYTLFLFYILIIKCLFF